MTKNSYCSQILIPSLNIPICISLDCNRYDAIFELVSKSILILLILIKFQQLEVNSTIVFFTANTSLYN